MNKILNGEEKPHQQAEHVSQSPRPGMALEHAKQNSNLGENSRHVPDPLAQCLQGSELSGEALHRTQAQEHEPAVGEACAVAQATRRGSVPGLSKAHISPGYQNYASTFASIEFYEGSNFLKVSRNRPPSPQKEPHLRGEVKKFSEASRRRMMDTMAKVKLDAIPKFVTLTYPDHFPMTHEQFKRDLDVLGKRILKRWPNASIIWKLEFKKRKSGENIGKIAPHYHLFIYGVPWKFPYEEEKGKHCQLLRTVGDDGFVLWKTHIPAYEKEIISTVGYSISQEDRPLEERMIIDISLDTLRHWIARNWYDIVGSNQLKHFQAGTRAEELKSLKGAYYYASKAYMGKTEDLSELDGSCTKPGRFWGIIGRKNLKLGERKILDITPKEAIQVHRFIRRFRRANTLPIKRRFLKFDHYSAKVYCDVNQWVGRLFKLKECDST